MIRKLYEKYLLETLFVTIALFFYLLDIGNLDGMRQGTEALYLQISKEMFETPSFLTPLYRGVPHWSKPPLHFWLPFPLYAIFQNTTLGLARSAIALITIVSSIHWAYWLNKRLKISPLTTLVFFLGSIGFIKYGRTYMMEIPLALITASSTLLFYDYIIEKRKRWLAIGALLLAFGVLVKGPVALVMSGGGVGIFAAIKSFQGKKIWHFKEIIIFFSISLILSSIWFLTVYLIHGQEVIDYFFLRENLGKFSSQTYPARKIFQGLLIYSLPWALLFPAIIKKILKEKNDLLLYMLINFGFFLAIWFIPSQRSHHYAIPALPFFIALLAISSNAITDRLFKILLSFPTVLLTLVLLIAIPVTNYSNWQIYLNLFFFLGSLTVLLFYKDRKQLATMLIAISIFLLWSVTMPTFYLPNFPSKYIGLVKDAKIGLVDRRTYFFEQVLNRTVSSTGTGQLNEFLAAKNSFVVIYQSRLDNLNLKDYKTVATWKKWIRKVTLKNITQAFKNSDITKLQENVYLIKRKT